MSIIQVKVLAILGLALIAKPAWGLTGSVSADYSSAFVSDDPIMSFGVKAQEALSYDLRLSFTQGLRRNLVVDDSKHEWEWNDSVLALAHSYKYSEALSFGSQLSARLPVSIESRHNELRTRPELKVSATWLLPLDLTSATDASYAIYWHKFDATRPEGQSTGGDALPQYTYNLNQTLTAVVKEKFELGVSGSYRLIRYHNLKQLDGYIAAQNRLEAYSYSVGFHSSYNITDKTSFTYSYEQGSGLERPGNSDFVIYDKEQAAWSISVTQIW